MKLKKYRGERRRKSKGLLPVDLPCSHVITVINSKFYINRRFVDHYQMENKHLGFAQDVDSGKWFFYLSYDSNDMELTVHRYAYYFFYYQLALKLKDEFRMYNSFFIYLNENYIIKDRMILFSFAAVGHYPNDLPRINAKCPLRPSSSFRLLEPVKIEVKSYYELLTSPDFMFRHV